MIIDLPISKSIANRILIRRAMLGLSLPDVDATRDPDDVVLLHDALQHLHGVLDLRNCGTAMRFLTAYCAATPGLQVVLDGCERMHERPIGQLVDCLRSLGADIRYVGRDGFPPIAITGKELRHEQVRLDNPLSTQFISALMLIGVAVETNICSPYIELTRGVMDGSVLLERDWSSAAFWMERWALGLCDYPEFPGLNPDSVQGDKACVALFERIRTMQAGQILSYDFSTTPDLYPAVAIACRVKGIDLQAAGTESLRIKESDRLCAVSELRVDNDHRMAMALLAADLPCDDVDCIRKSYPKFCEQLHAVRNLNAQ